MDNSDKEVLVKASKNDEKPAETRMNAGFDAAGQVPVKTWRERIGVAADYQLHGPSSVERAMVAQIADLEAALVQAATRNDELIQHQAGKAMDLAEARAELAMAKSVELGVDIVAVRFNDLMALARQIIAEQMDDCDELFMAGRAHGVGSFHSEILELSKRTALAPREPEAAVHGSLSAAILSLEPEAGQTPGFLIGYACARTAAAKLAANQPAGDTETCRSSEKVLEKNGAVEEVLSTLLWLYRRLPRCYGRPPFIEYPIQRLAVKVGIKVDDDLAERGPASDIEEQRP